MHVLFDNISLLTNILFNIIVCGRINHSRDNQPLSSDQKMIRESYYLIEWPFFSTHTHTSVTEPIIGRGGGGGVGVGGGVGGGGGGGTSTTLAACSGII